MQVENKEPSVRLPVCIGVAALDPCPLHEIVFTVSNKYRIAAVAGREDWMAHMALTHVYYTLSRIQEGMDWVIGLGLGLKGALEHYARVWTPLRTWGACFSYMQRAAPQSVSPCVARCRSF